MAVIIEIEIFLINECRSIVSHVGIPETTRLVALLADEILNLSDPEYSLLIRQRLLSQQVPRC